ncbi:MAG: hypothetical protein FWC36_06435 [Spirochaetes bacterium]|nr:hypothetical protein [Spirochaetota bacterium]
MKKALLLLFITISFFLFSCNWTTYANIKVRNDSPDRAIAFKLIGSQVGEQTIAGEGTTIFVKSLTHRVERHNYETRVYYTLRNGNEVIFNNRNSVNLEVARSFGEDVHLTANGFMGIEPLIILANDTETGTIYTTRPVFTVVSNYPAVQAEWTYNAGTNTVYVTIR